MPVPSADELLDDEEDEDDDDDLDEPAADVMLVRTLHIPTGHKTGSYMTVPCLLQPSAFNQGLHCFCRLDLTLHCVGKYAWLPQAVGPQQSLIAGSEHSGLQGPRRADACAGRKEADVAENTTANQEAQGGGQGP